MIRFHFWCWYILCFHYGGKKSFVVLFKRTCRDSIGEYMSNETDNVASEILLCFQMVQIYQSNVDCNLIVVAYFFMDNFVANKKLYRLDCLGAQVLIILHRCHTICNIVNSHLSKTVGKKTERRSILIIFVVSQHLPAVADTLCE